MGMAMVMVTMKPEMSQLMWLTPPSSPTMVGMAVEKIICPSELMSMVVSSAAKISPRRGAWAGAWVAGGVVVTMSAPSSGW